MSEQIENAEITKDMSGKVVDINAILLNSAASAYAYNKINNVLLMQILAKLENRDLEEIRTNVERYIAEFSQEFIVMNK